MDYSLLSTVKHFIKWRAEVFNVYDIVLTLLYPLSKLRRSFWHLANKRWCVSIEDIFPHKNGLHWYFFFPQNYHYNFERLYSQNIKFLLFHGDFISLKYLNNEMKPLLFCKRRMLWIFVIEFFSRSWIVFT